MKKSIFLFAFLLVAGMVSAQTAESSKKSCSKTCAKTCTKAKGETSAAVAAPEIKVASATSAADIAAEAHESIERRVCEMSGAIGYYKKHTCEVSGKVSFDEVFYDEDSRTFVTSVASAQAESLIEAEGAKKASCSGKENAKACAPGCAKDCCKKA